MTLTDNDISQIDNQQPQSKVLTDADIQAHDSANSGDVFWQNHPYLKAMSDTGNQILVNPVVQGLNGIEPAVRGMVKGIGVPDNRNTVTPLNRVDMTNAPPVARVLGDVVGGGIKGLVATAAGGGNPFIGYGALSGLGAYGNNQPVLPAVAGGVLSGIPQAIAGYAGSKLAQTAAQPLAKSFSQFAPQITKYAPNVGIAAGMGGASATEAAMTGGNPIEAGATGATFGAFSPMAGKQQVTQEQFNDLISKHGDMYRKILNPGKNIINSTNIDVDNATQNLAKQGISINTDVNHKLDNTQGIQQLQQANKPYYDQAQQILQTLPDKTFDLNDIATQAKQNASKYFKNADERINAKTQVNKMIASEIAENGGSSIVNASNLYTIKQGMYERAFDPLNPTSNNGARAIGSTIKGVIENAFPESPIREINQKIGDNLEAQRLLEQTNGNVVQGGKLGGHFSRILGAMGGYALSNAPGLSEIPGVREGGWAAGAWAGGEINNWMNDPTRITSAMANKIKNIQVTNPSLQETTRPGTVTPEIINPSAPIPRNIPVSNQQAIGSFNPIGLPSPQNVPYNPAQHTVMGEGAIRQGAAFNPGVIKDVSQIPGLNLRLPSQGTVSPIQTGTSLERGGGKLTPNIISEQPAQRTTPGASMPFVPGGGMNDPAMRELWLRKAQEEGMIPPVQQPSSPSQSPLNPINAMANQGQGSSAGVIPPAVKALGLAGAIGLGSMFNPLNAQAQQIPEPTRLNLPSPQYTQKEEGFSATPYIDTKGIKTIGYGFNMQDKEIQSLLPKDVLQHRRPLTKPEADRIFEVVYGNAQDDAIEFAGSRWNTMSYNQKKALTDMAYNLGSTKLDGFTHLYQAIQSGNFYQASKEILNSKYAREDVPNRALRNAALMQR